MFRNSLIPLAFVLAPLAASAGSTGIPPPACQPGQASCVPPELPPSGHQPPAGLPQGAQPSGGHEAPPPASRSGPDAGQTPSLDEQCPTGATPRDADCVRDDMDGGQAGDPRGQGRTGPGAGAGEGGSDVRPGQ